MHLQTYRCNLQYTMGVSKSLIILPALCVPEFSGLQLHHVETLVPLNSLKLRNVEPGHYLDG